MNNLAHVTVNFSEDRDPCPPVIFHGHWCFSIRSFTWKNPMRIFNCHVWPENISILQSLRKIRELSGDRRFSRFWGWSHRIGIDVWFFWVISCWWLVAGPKLAAGRSQTFQEPNRGLFSREFHRTWVVFQFQCHTENEKNRSNRPKFHVSFLGVFAVEWPCSQPTSVEIFLHVFWHLDILMTFITAIYCRGELVVAPKRIARNYAQGWLCFDVLYLPGAFICFFIWWFWLLLSQSDTMGCKWDGSGI